MSKPKRRVIVDEDDEDEVQQSTVKISEIHSRNEQDLNEEDEIVFTRGRRNSSKKIY